jgi:hypothetical protein
MAPTCVQRIPPRRPSGRVRRGLLAAAFLLAFGFPLLASAVPTGEAPPPAATLQERSAVEKASRSRYRTLELSSLVLILVAGGAAAWWALRRK